MRIAWRSVGAIVARVWADTDKTVDRFADLRRIGIDEISYKRHHSTSRWWSITTPDRCCGPPGTRQGHLRGSSTPSATSAPLRSPTSPLMPPTGSPPVVAERCPAAVLCADPFHVVAWATEALDTERRRAWNDARALARSGTVGVAAGPAEAPRRGPGERARQLKGARYALWKNRKTLTEAQAPSWPGSPRPTPEAAPTCSKKDFAACIHRQRQGKANRPWTGGSPGRGAAASPPFVGWPVASSSTAGLSTPPSNTACPQGLTEIHQPKSGYWTGSPSDSDPRSAHRPSHAGPRRHRPSLPGRKTTHG